MYIILFFLLFKEFVNFIHSVNTYSIIQLEKSYNWFKG